VTAVPFASRYTDCVTTAFNVASNLAKDVGKNERITVIQMRILPEFGTDEQEQFLHDCDFLYFHFILFTSTQFQP
jgi:hypothetical protein